MELFFPSGCVAWQEVRLFNKYTKQQLDDSFHQKAFLFIYAFGSVCQECHHFLKMTVDLMATFCKSSSSKNICRKKNNLRYTWRRVRMIRLIKFTVWWIYFPGKRKTENAIIWTKSISYFYATFIRIWLLKKLPEA